MEKQETVIPEGVEQATPETLVEYLTQPDAPEMTPEEAAILAHEGEAALRDIGEEQLEPPAPFDISGCPVLYRRRQQGVCPCYIGADIAEPCLRTG